MTLSWDDFRYLFALREAGSLSAAARALKADTSTVSRRIAALESALGVQLVLRTPDGVKFNDAGVHAADASEAIERAVRELMLRIGGSDLLPEGLVRVTVTDGFAAFAYEGLAPLRAQYPGIHVELVVTSSRVDLARGDAHIAVRFFRDQSGDLVVKKVGTLGWSLYTTDAYIARRGLPTIDNLDEHDIIGFDEAASRSPGGLWLAANAKKSRIVSRALSVTAVLSALRAGMGVSLVPCFEAERAGPLHRVLEDPVVEGDAFLVTHPSTKSIARVRLVFDALEDLFRREAAVLSGRVAKCDPASVPSTPRAPRAKHHAPTAGKKAKRDRS